MKIGFTVKANNTGGGSVADLRKNKKGGSISSLTRVSVCDMIIFSYCSLSRLEGVSVAPYSVLAAKKRRTSRSLSSQSATRWKKQSNQRAH